MASSASVVRSALPMRSSVTASAIDARHAQQHQAGNLTYVTLLSTRVDAEAMYGVLGLQRSLQRVQSMHPLLCLCVNVTEDARGTLQQAGVQVRDVAPIDPGRPGAFGKMQVLRLLEYRRVLFLDVDTIVLRNIDHLFELQCDFAFAPDVGVEVSPSRLNAINAGVFVHTPQQSILKNIMEHKDATLRKGSFSSLAKEQFLQEFINANRETLRSSISICDLDVMYNVKRQMFFQHPRLWNCMRPSISVMQFGGRQKPWHVASTFSHQTQGGSAGARVGGSAHAPDAATKGDSKANATSANAAHAQGGKTGAAKAAPTLASRPDQSAGAARPPSTQAKPEHSSTGAKSGPSAAGRAATHDAQLQQGSQPTKSKTSEPAQVASAKGNPAKTSTASSSHPGLEPGLANRHASHSSGSADAHSQAESASSHRPLPPGSPPSALWQQGHAFTSHGAPPASPFVDPVHAVSRSTNATKTRRARRRRLESAAPVKPGQMPKPTGGEQPKPTSNDPLFGAWWVLYEERKYLELPSAKQSVNTTVLEVDECDAGGSCPSQSEKCMHEYLAHSSFVLSASDWHVLPYMMLGLAVAMMWLTLLVYASFCPSRLLTGATGKSLKKPLKEDRKPSVSTGSADMWYESPSEASSPGSPQVCPVDGLRAEAQVTQSLPAPAGAWNCAGMPPQRKAHQSLPSFSLGRITRTARGAVGEYIEKASMPGPGGDYTRLPG